MRLDSSEGRKAAGLCVPGAARASARAADLSEVLVIGTVLSRDVVGVYVVDFGQPFGARMLKHCAFRKDYLDMVAPRVLGRPDWDAMRARLLGEFTHDGAHCDVESGEVHLPEKMWAEFASNAAARGLISAG